MTVFVCFVTLCLSAALTPLAALLATCLGAVDVPLDRRRMHKSSTPRAGGVSVFTAFAVGCCVLPLLRSHIFPLLLGGGLMLAVGVADDIHPLGAWQKLGLQVFVSVLTLSGGFRTWEPGGFFALLWVLTLTNAHNFIDGLDGLLGGCSLIEGVSLFLCFLLLGRGGEGLAALLLALSCGGFLLFNRHPARIFAGDCGSCTVGFLYGCLSLSFFSGGAGVLLPLVPLLLFAYPLSDLLTVSVRRILRGKSPFCADRGHLHHRISDAGLDQVHCVRVLLSIALGFCTVGVCTVTGEWLSVGSLLCVALALFLTRIRRYIEHFT